MAIQQTAIGYYESAKNTFGSDIQAIQSNISVGDCIAYFNEADKTFYILRVISVPSNVSSHPAQDVMFEACGVKLKLNMDVHTYGVSDIINVIANGKDSAWMACIGTGQDYPMNGDSYIDYIEIFSRDNFSVTSLLHNFTVKFEDDIVGFTVFPTPLMTSHGVSALECINGIARGGVPVYLSGQSNTLTFKYDIMYGIARTLMLNCIYSL